MQVNRAFPGRTMRGGNPETHLFIQVVRQHWQMFSALGSESKCSLYYKVFDICCNDPVLLLQHKTALKKICKQLNVSVFQ